MITVTIWRKTLVRLGVCERGLELFDTIAHGQASGNERQRTRRVRVQWTPLADLWLRTVQPDYAGWLHARRLIPMLSLVRANLSGANLSGANLDGANLYGANLVRANLSGANLYGANIDGANLDGANLSVANLSGANLSGANLYGANLVRANLSGANLSGANIDGAILGSREAPQGGPKDTRRS